MTPKRSEPVDLEHVNDPSEVPSNLTAEEEIEFWETHGVTEEFLEKAESIPEEELPRFRPRTKPINIRFDEFTLGRLKSLAERRNVGYQTLLKQFVTDRLYEEEKREGLLWADQAAEEERTETLADTATEQGAKKKRDWQSEVFKFVEENKELVEDEDLEFLVSASLLGESTSLLLELSDEIKAASSKKGFPRNKLKRMLKAFDRLKEFCDRAFTVHEAKFGLPESNDVVGLSERNREREDYAQHEQSEEEGEHQEGVKATILSLDKYRKAKANRATLTGETG